MRKNNRAISVFLFISCFLGLVWVGLAAAAGQASPGAGSNMLVPGEQGRYTLVAQAEEPLALAVDDYVYQVKVVQTLPADRDTDVLVKEPILVLMDQPIKIVAPERIQVLEAPGTTPVDGSQVAVQGRTVIMTVPLSYDTQYQVVFGERALESTVKAAVYNAAFSWNFSTEAASGGENGGDDSSSGGNGGEEGT